MESSSIHCHCFYVYTQSLLLRPRKQLDVFNGNKICILMVTLSKEAVAPVLLKHQIIMYINLQRA